MTEANSGYNSVGSPGGGVEGLSVPSVGKNYVYSCKRCRRELFCHSEVVKHEPSKLAKGHKSFGYRGGVEDMGCDVCTCLFLDPDMTTWVLDQIREGDSAHHGVISDNIYCPNTSCLAKLGTWSWSGGQCSCGQWVTPAFKVQQKTVDQVER